ncbi:xanthine dehydrogenase family protein subunit M [Soehngenia saccharolytica]|jgi:carbon-monoxide dehydrogenase medium subunit/xanthine dehydrogenase FAD-binding subunit|nr:xanthine dehydrogenase family protein subunit M [Soehngenia saccharolytica]
MKVYKANTIEETLDILSTVSKSKVIAGGTDLILDLRNKKLDIECLVDITSIDELNRIDILNDEYIIGSAVPFSKILEFSYSNNLKGFVKAIGQIGSPQIRNRGTIGGNLANASTSADSAPALLALDAKVCIASKTNSVEIPMSEFYDHLRDDLNDGIITYIKFKELSRNSYLGFEKLGFRKSLAISKLSISTNITLNERNEIENILIASGAIGKFPMREYEVESQLLNRKLDNDSIGLAITTMKSIMSERLGRRTSLPYKQSAIEYIFKNCFEETINYFKRC